MWKVSGSGKRRRGEPRRSANYEQNVNKGADKKTEDFTLRFLLVRLALNYLSNPMSRPH